MPPLRHFQAHIHLGLHFQTRGHFASPWDVWQRLKIPRLSPLRTFLASREQDTERLLHILRCPERPPQPWVVHTPMSIVLRLETPRGHSSAKERSCAWCTAQHGSCSRHALGRHPGGRESILGSGAVCAGQLFPKSSCAFCVGFKQIFEESNSFNRMNLFFTL